MCSRRIKIFKKAASEEAEKSPCNFKHGAIITISNKILIRGFNNPRTKFLRNIKSCQHAEMSVITKFETFIKKKNLTGKKKKIYINKCTLWVIRTTRTNKHLCNSAPCLDCLNSIKKLGLKKIGFSDKTGALKLIKVKDFKTTHKSHAQKNLAKYLK